MLSASAFVGYQPLKHPRVRYIARVVDIANFRNDKLNKEKGTLRNKQSRS